ncbi:hypothetical protein, partial [Nonomuraea sp. K271]
IGVGRDGGTVSRPARGGGTRRKWDLPLLFERGPNLLPELPLATGCARVLSPRRTSLRVASAMSVSWLTSSLVVSMFVGVRMDDLLPCGPKKRPNKISKSNTMSIELPYDVVHHARDFFEEDSNNCLKMIFNRDTVAVCDNRTTDWEVRR